MATIFPPLAGICSYEDAARLGLSVADTTAVLHRFAYVKQRLAITAAAHFPSTPEWEAKGAFALHAWLDADHAGRLYARIGELRHPAPGVHDVPDEALAAVMDQALESRSTPERIAATYGVIRPALEVGLRAFLEAGNPLCDQPSQRVVRAILEEDREMARWGTAALETINQSDGFRQEAADWSARIDAYLRCAGGVAGREPRDAAIPPAPRARGNYRPDILPARDDRFSGLFDTSTPADFVYLDPGRPLDERNLALLFKRLREMDVPEVIAGIVIERWLAERRMAATASDRGALLPWSYYTNMLRQMWDEARHSMLGEAALEARGIDWRQLPINVTFSWKLARFCSPLERHILLYAIEQSLMPRAQGTPYEHEVAKASGDALSALYHDFDWADEVVHVDIARRCLLPELVGGLGEARSRAEALWQRIAGELEREGFPASREPAPHWWVRFAEQALGHAVDPPPQTHVKDWRPAGQESADQG